MPGFIPWSNVDVSLHAQRSIWVCIIRPDGRPHAAPVWYCWDSTRLYFVTARRTQKAKNLAQQPWVVIHAGDGDDVIVLEGIAEVVLNERQRTCVNAMYGEKYVDPETGTKATIFGEGNDLYHVQITRIMTWEYGSVRTRTDWTFDAEHDTFRLGAV